MKLSKSLQDNINTASRLLPLNKSFDLITRRMELCHMDSYFIGINGYLDSRILHNLFSDLQSIYFSDLQPTGNFPSEILRERLMDAIPAIQIKYYDNWDDLLKNLLSGPFLLFFEGIDKGFCIDIRNYPARSISEPENEKILRGSKDGFVETLLLNANLIRRRIRSPKLTFEITNVGSQSKTDVALAYMNGEADSQLLEQIRQRLSAMDISALTMGTQSMEELLSPRKWYHPLPSLFRTERPDVACSYLLEGYILLLVDTTPSVLVLPASIFQHSQSPEDYYKPPLIGNYIRLYRFLCALISLFLLPLFLLFSMNPDLLPPGVHLLPTGDLSPFRLFIYVLFAELALDLFKYSSSHSPDGFSGSLSIVGGLLIGDVAVKLQWASSEIIFYAAATVLASLSLSSLELSDALRMYRLFLLLCTGLFGLINPSFFPVSGGLIGFLVGLVFILLSIITTPAPLGRSYFWPLVPFNRQALRSLLFRYPIKRKQPPQIWERNK
ncbi:MAG: spore germination protein [Lachnospiraceae bacterium]|nr:spore germination protein [Lachnospiraceae bacterium]